MDDVTTANFFGLLRVQAAQIADLSDQLSALLNCLFRVPDFQKSFEDEKHLVQTYNRLARQATLSSIDELIQSLKKSNGSV